MSTKLRGGEESELTKLKRLWLKPSFVESREFWREQFASTLKQPEIRALLKKKLQINLQWNRQLTEFNHWLARQDILDAEGDAMIQDEEQAAREHPDWTKEQIREDVLKKSYLRARASGDFKLGLKTVAADAKLEALQFDKEKFKEGLRTKLEAGLDAVAEAFKKNPQAMEFYKKARAMIAHETK